MQDISATTDAAGDTNPGDIRNAQVTFVNRDASNAVLCTASAVNLIDPSDAKTGTASCQATLTVDNTGAQQYHIGVVVNNYYTRNSGFDDGVVTVYQPLPSGFITGGGYVNIASLPADTWRQPERRATSALT